MDGHSFALRDFAAAGRHRVRNAEDTTGENSITVYHRGQSEVRSFKKKKSPFGREAEAFLETIESRNHGRNPPADALLDLRIAEAISISARENRTVSLE